MGKATHRRERSLSKHLGELACSNPSQFKQEWKKLLNAWSAEAMRRGGRLHDEATDSPQLPVHAVLEKARRLLTLCGDEASRLVGAATRDFLEHDCAKAFAQAVEPHLYWLTNSDRNRQLMRAGTHRSPR